MSEVRETVSRGMPALDEKMQARVGLKLTLILLCAWFCTHAGAVFLYPLTSLSLSLSPLLILALSWLDVGVFIVAHDCMHGALVPGHAWLNRRVGQLCLTLYAGFDFDVMQRKHWAHHRAPGTHGDPDFHDHPRHRPLRWYGRFFREYSSLRQLFVISLLFWSCVLLLGAEVESLLLFWALPSVLSSFQLFWFGTYLPHRPSGEAFVDEHRARSNDYPPWLSLLTCFHFGYHHEHHRNPHLPWWYLPVARAHARVVPARAAFG